MARFYRTSKMFCCSLVLTTPYLMLSFHFQLICLPLLTLEMVRGMLKSFPPCSLKPYGAGPFRVTVYVLIFCLMSALLLLTAPSVGALSPPLCLTAGYPSRPSPQSPGGCWLLHRPLLASQPSLLVWVQLSGQTPRGAVVVVSRWVGQVLWTSETHTHTPTRAHTHTDNRVQSKAEPLQINRVSPWNQKLPKNTKSVWTGSFKSYFLTQNWDEGGFLACRVGEVEGHTG